LAGGTGLTLSTNTLSVDAAQTQITSVGTLGSLTVTGDLTVDTSTLKVDSTNNRVGILDATPAVSLDAGSATDAFFVPKGTTAQRPTGVDGYFRYNTDDAQFEGYADGEWGAIAGSGSGSAIEPQIFAGDGSTVNFTLTSAPTSENNLLVFIDGVFQAHDSYSVSGTTLTFSTAPANTRVVTVYHARSNVSGANMIVDTMTGDNSDTTLTLSVAPVSVNNVQVYFDGVYQNKANYSISGTTLTFSTAPATGVAVEAITHTQTTINEPAANTVTPTKIAAGDFYFDTDTLYIDSTNNRVGIGTTSPSVRTHIYDAATDAVLYIDSGSVNGSHARFLASGSVKHFVGSGGGFSLGDVDDFAIRSFDNILFSTGNSSTERLRIDSIGRVGIGTSSFVNANAKLVVSNGTVDIEHYTDTDIGYVGTRSNHPFGLLTNGAPKLYITTSGNVGIGTSSPSYPLTIGTAGTTTDTTMLIGSSTTTAGNLFFGDATSGVGSYSGFVQYDHNTDSMRFGTSSTERLRIDSSGRLLINTTAVLDSSEAKLQVLQTVTGHWSTRINNSTGNPFGITIDYTAASPNGTANQFHYCTDTGGARWGVYSNGGVLNYSGNNVNLSDRNAKKDITLHTDDEWNCVKAWEIVDYRYKDEADDSPTKIGVIAQQIQEHCPELVSVFQEQSDAVEEVLDEDGEVVTAAKPAVEERIGVNEPQMMWKVTKALQEAMTRIETLEAKITTLENA
jgi:hypothetical protein